MLRSIYNHYTMQAHQRATINNDDSKCGGSDFDIPLVGGKAASRRTAASLCLI